MFKRISSALLVTCLAVAVTPIMPAQAATQRIVSLSPSATEILFAIGAGPKVVAVDNYSNFPANAPMTDLSAFTPNLEAILTYKPDLVVLSSDSTKSDVIAESLKKLKIQVYLEKAPTNLKGVYAEIRDLGRLTKNSKAAAKITIAITTNITKVLITAKKYQGFRIYHELDNTYYSATSKTFIGQAYKSFGVENIADAAAGADSSGYPQLSAEYIVKSNPQIIFLADAQYGVKKVDLEKRAGWQGVDAVVNGNVIELPADIPSRWGPRIVDFYKIVLKSLMGATKK